jgi:hypothetical protein
LEIFFLYFSEFFFAILMKPNKAKQSVVESGKQLRDEPVLIEEYVELWVGTQYDSMD